MKILIVGAGISGLSMARLLEEKRIDYKIIEKKGSLNTTGSGIALPFNALRALKEIGVYDQVMKNSHKVKEINYTKSNGELLSRADLTGYPFSNDSFVALKRNKLIHILAEGIENKIHYSTEITSANNYKNGVSVECSNTEIAGRYDLMIAADGVNSPSRDKQLRNTKTLYNHKITGWRFIVKSSNHQLEPTYMLGNSDLFMAYPLSKDELYCYAHIHQDNSFYTLSGDTQKDIKRIFSSYAEPARSILKSINELNIITGELKSVTEARFYKNRIVFIGDAANACSPLLQQGAAAAFEDVLSLSKALSQNKIDLEQYRRARQARIEWIIQYSDKPLANIKKMDNFIIRFIRNMIIRHIGPLNVYGWIKLATNPHLTKK